MSKDFDKAMGAAIDELRKESGFTMAQLGEALGVTYQQVSKCIRGTNRVSAHYLPILADLFGVTIADLYARAGAVAAPSSVNPANNDAIMAARYMRLIPNETERQDMVDYLRKRAYRKRLHAGASA